MFDVKQQAPQTMTMRLREASVQVEVQKFWVRQRDQPRSAGVMYGKMQHGRKETLSKNRRFGPLRF